MLGSEDALRELVVSEIEADAKTYGDERRTLIEEDAGDQGDRASERRTGDRVHLATLLGAHAPGPRHRRHSIAFKDGDSIAATYECRTTDHCIVICSNGRVCSIPVSPLPSGRGDGAPLATFIELAPGAKIAHAFCGKTDPPADLHQRGLRLPLLHRRHGRPQQGGQTIHQRDKETPSCRPSPPTEHSLVAVLSKAARCWCSCSPN